MIWIDLTNKGIDGWAAAWALEYAGIVANRQTVPGEKKSAYYPTGLRLGTPAVTTRGMKEEEMKKIAGWIDDVIKISTRLPDGQVTNFQFLIEDMGNADRKIDQEARKKFKEELQQDKTLAKIAQEVKRLCAKFPVP